MTSYKRHGHTWSDVLDHTTFGPGRHQLGTQGRIAGNTFYLKHAAHLRFERDVAAARRYLAKAREYRLELAAR